MEKKGLMRVYKKASQGAYFGQEIQRSSERVTERKRERGKKKKKREMGSLGAEVVDEVTWLASSGTLPILSLNHVSFICKSVSRSVKFYEEVLGFVLIKRPSSFDFEGAWLFNYGIGIHLLESDRAPEKKSKINPKDNHISFQCSDMGLVMRKLEEMNVEYVTAVVEDGGIKVDQLFFHDPDGYMVEICNCHVLPVLPLSACPLKLPSTTTNFTAPSFYRKQSSDRSCAGEVATMMMENLVLDMMNISL